MANEFKDLRVMAMRALCKISLLLAFALVDDGRLVRGRNRRNGTGFRLVRHAAPRSA